MRRERGGGRLVTCVLVFWFVNAPTRLEKKTAYFNSGGCKFWPLAFAFQEVFFGLASRAPLLFLTLVFFIN